jgi:hypothetical protein
MQIVHKNLVSYQPKSSSKKPLGLWPSFSTKTGSSEGVTAAGEITLFTPSKSPCDGVGPTLSALRSARRGKKISILEENYLILID